MKNLLYVTLGALFMLSTSVGSVFVMPSEAEAGPRELVQAAKQYKRFEARLNHRLRRLVNAIKHSDLRPALKRRLINFLLSTGHDADFDGTPDNVDEAVCDSELDRITDRQGNFVETDVEEERESDEQL